MKHLDVAPGRQLPFVTRFTLIMVMEQGSSLISCATLASPVCHRSEVPKEKNLLLWAVGQLVAVDEVDDKDDVLMKIPADLYWVCEVPLSNL